MYYSTCLLLLLLPIKYKPDIELVQNNANIVYKEKEGAHLFLHDSVSKFFRRNIGLRLFFPTIDSVNDANGFSDMGQQQQMPGASGDPLESGLNCISINGFRGLTLSGCCSGCHSAARSDTLSNGGLSSLVSESIKIQ